MNCIHCGGKGYPEEYCCDTSYYDAAWSNWRAALAAILITLPIAALALWLIF